MTKSVTGVILPSCLKSFLRQDISFLIFPRFLEKPSSAKAKKIFVRKVIGDNSESILLEIVITIEEEYIVS